MITGLEALKDMEYPGRFIMAGRGNTTNIIAVYGITGRSASSKARKIVLKEEKRKQLLTVAPTNMEVLRSGNLDLLIYTACIINNNGITVSNGKQTEQVSRWLGSKDSIQALAFAHRFWDYELDSPNFTPRITACIKDNIAALGIIKRHKDGNSKRVYVELPLVLDEGYFIATYSGQIQDPLPPFQGEPLALDLEGITTSSEITGRAFYDALTPKDPTKDFRVSIAAVHYNLRSSHADITIINAADMQKGIIKGIVET
ncbi:hypothetical protein J4455_04385 [Candidatus Woesearchaeota archaeon]|nr:hypothetical protein [Candidatus Woesearchaeota archaeon]